MLHFTGVSPTYLKKFPIADESVLVYVIYLKSNCKKKGKPKIVYMYHVSAHTDAKQNTLTIIICQGIII